jgi:hypothetical protein
LPRSTPNSRVKDLVDLLLLARTGEVRQAQLAEAVPMTFDRRKTHAIPSALVPPPETWERQFRALAAECGLTSGMEDSQTIPRAAPAAPLIFAWRITKANAELQSPLPECRHLLRRSPHSRHVLYCEMYNIHRAAFWPLICYKLIRMEESTRLGAPAISEPLILRSQILRTSTNAIN